MTKEEAVKVIEGYRIHPYEAHAETCEYNNEALDMAIEALSKPIVDITQRDLCADISCTDCPFMQETCKLMDYVAYAEVVQGEWIHDGQNFKGGLDWCHCSECGYKTSANGLSVYRFCPNCGAKMTKGGDSE